MTEHRKDANGDSTPLQARIEWMLRLFLATSLVYSGISDGLDPLSFARSIYRYDLLHTQFIGPAAIILPWLEITTGLFLLLSPRYRKSAALLAILLLLLFAGTIATSLIRGIETDCPCFGRSISRNNVAAFLGNTGLLVTAFWIWLRCELKPTENSDEIRNRHPGNFPKSV